MSSRRKQHKPNRVQSDGPGAPSSNVEAKSKTLSKSQPMNLVLPNAVYSSREKHHEDVNANQVHLSPGMSPSIPNFGFSQASPADSQSVELDNMYCNSNQDDPARRNKRGNRGTGKVQPRQLDNGDEVFVCPACEKEGTELLLRSREELTSHLRTHNKPIETGGGHICAICARELSSQSSLDRHMLTHSDERPYACPLCPTSFTTNGNMRRHLSTHKSDPSLMEEVNRYLNSDKRRKRSRNSMEVLKAAVKETSNRVGPVQPPPVGIRTPSSLENQCAPFNQGVPNFYQWLNSSFPLMQNMGTSSSSMQGKLSVAPKFNSSSTGKAASTPVNKSLDVQKAASADDATTVRASAAAANGRSHWLPLRFERNPRAYYFRSRGIRAAHHLRQLSIRLLRARPAFGRVSMKQLKRLQQQRRDRHCGRRESSNIISCDICQRKCVGKKGLTVHRACVHESPANKTIYCCLGRYEDGEPCQEKDEDLSSMKRHVMINHIKIDPYICKLCNPGAILNVGLEDKHLHKQPGSFCTKENVHRHLLQKKNHEMIAEMKTKMDVSKFKVFVEKAKVEFTGVVQIRDDVKNRFIGDDSSTCNICQIDFKSVESLRRHFDSSPKCQILFSCPRCSQDLPVKEMLMEHMKSKHGEAGHVPVTQVREVRKRLRFTKHSSMMSDDEKRDQSFPVCQPLDLSMPGKKDAENDSGYPQGMSSPDSHSSPDKEEAIMMTPPRPPMPFFPGNAFVNPWSSPLWPGLASLGYAGVWPQQASFYLQQQLSHLAAVNPDFLMKSKSLAGVDPLKAFKTSTPGVKLENSYDESARRVQTSKCSDLSVSKAELCHGSAMSRDETDGQCSSSADSGDEGPSRKRIKKKNSYKDAPNLIYCPFQNCKQSFPWMSSLKRHIITHTNHKPYCCTRCTQSFSTKSNRERHMERIHHIKVKGSQSSTYLTTEELSTFSEHDKIAEKIGEDLLNQLGHSVVTSVNPQRLMKSDSPEVEERDSAVDFSISGSMNSCNSGLSGPQYKCPECNIFSVDRVEVLEHMKTSHPEVWTLVASRHHFTSTDDILSRSDGSLLFDEEEFQSDNDSPMSGSSSKRLMCALCTRRFWSSQDLQRHTRSHTGLKPFSCQYCGRNFSLKHSLQRHTKSHHSNPSENGSDLFQPWINSADSPSGSQSSLHIETEAM